MTKDIEDLKREVTTALTGHTDCGLLTDVCRTIDHLAALNRIVPEGWRPIETAPRDESYGPFLVRIPKNDVADSIAIQVSIFEGQMYADVMDGIIDWEDRITTATHWKPLETKAEKIAKEFKEKQNAESR